MEKKLNNKDLLEISARMDEIIEHPDNCGHCSYRMIMAQTAREFLENKNYDYNAYVKESRSRWQETKYFKTYQEAIASGKDPQELFNERNLGDL